MQQDVIMDCLDDPDVSIRLQALELTAGMITSDTLQVVVNRLVNQLQVASSQDILDPEEILLSHMDEESRQRETPHAPNNSLNMPSDYRSEVIHRILDVCSQNNYSELVDFVWYIEVLVQLVKLLPPSDVDENWHESAMGDQENPTGSKMAVASRIGTELRNIAVRVKGVRLEATRAAESLLLVDNKAKLFPATSNVGIGVLGPAAWISGEYAGYLQSPSRTLQSLIDPLTISLPPSTLQLFLQAIPKVLVRMDRSHQTQEAWRSEISLLLVRVIAFLETIAAHPDLDVQERAIEFLEVLRLGAESLRSDPQEVPILLASVIPNLFAGLDLNPVATSAQGRVVLPPDLRLNDAFLGNLPDFFRGMNEPVADTTQHHSIQKFYYDSNHASLSSGPPQMHAQLSSATLQPDASYQNTIGGATEYTDAIDKRKIDRRERYRDDPFYIAPIGAPSGMSSPRRGVPSPSSDPLDIDSIPIVDLKLAGENLDRPGLDARDIRSTQSTSRMEVTADETFGQEGPTPSKHLFGTAKGTTLKQSLLQVDSSGLEDLNLETKSDAEPVLPPGGDDVEMKKALQNVEQMRLRMQRASERIQLEGIPAEGTLIKKKKKGKKSDDNTKSVRRKKKVKEEKISVLE